MYIITINIIIYVYLFILYMYRIIIYCNLKKTFIFNKYYILNNEKKFFLFKFIYCYLLLIILILYCNYAKGFWRIYATLFII